MNFNAVSVNDRLVVQGHSRRSECSGLHPSSFRTALYLSASAALALSSSVVHLLCPWWAWSRCTTQCQGLICKLVFSHTIRKVWVDMRRMETVGAGEVLLRVRMGKRKLKSAKTMRLCGSY